MPTRPRIKLPAQAQLRDTAIPQERNTVKTESRYVKATLYLPRPVHEQLRKLAYERHSHQQTIMLEALDQWLERECGKTIRELTQNNEPLSATE
jgi:hypothetical protein